MVKKRKKELDYFNFSDPKKIFMDKKTTSVKANRTNGFAYLIKTKSDRRNPKVN